MIPFPPAALVACLILLCTTLLALGVYWLRLRKPSVVQSQPCSAVHAPEDLSFDDDEWESQAPYPEHIMQAVHSQQTRPIHPDPREDLHEAIESLMGEPPEPPKPSPSAIGVVPRCPRCLSSRVDTRNLARKAGSTIGSVAGATGGMAAALAGAETGAVVGAFAGPVGSIFGGLAGAVIAGLVGSAAGCAAGSAVGAALDDNVLDNHICLARHHAFSVTQN